MIKLMVFVFVLSIAVAAPISEAQEFEMVDCCFRPCSCLGSKAGPPTCKKLSRRDCKDQGGEEVSDCLLCQ